MQNTLKPVKSYLLPLTNMEIAVSEWGCEEGEPILALHGWLDNMASFYPLVSHSDWLKSNNIRFIAIDWPGHGHSSHRKFSHPYHFLEYVQDLHDMVETINVNKITILGHSLGGAIATLYAGIFPDKVANLILIEGLGPLSKTAEEAPEQLAKSIIQRNRFRDGENRFFEDLKKVIMARIHNTDISEENAALLLIRNMNKTEQGYEWRSDPRLRLPSAMMLTPEQVKAFIELITMPVLLLYGIDGFVNRYPEVKKRIAYHPHILTKELDGGHHLHMQYPEQVISSLLQFINK